MMWKLVFPALAAVFTLGSAALIGGPRDIDVNDSGVQNALNFAVVQHNRGTNDMFVSQVAEVIKAQSQVVAGIKYIITVRMGRTDCRKDSGNQQCTIHQGNEKARLYQCTFTVWSRPWLRDGIQLLDEKCQ
ncbi:cystatin C (amyloid angiopathy and cerebral hemorrhage) [Scomber japonicus]|uniref:cystatin C (amyloid angiopathy and cerebral hemorrhage) n=1 Tax=Scomber japonicus TaxID=13676 RepID=UPI002304FA01|nr:cystatin C (amyloid angiopathy and cerebral hemorrhage) [Scomber japonicus]